VVKRFTIKPSQLHFITVTISITTYCIFDCVILDVNLVTQVTDGCNIERETEILSRPTSNERHLAMYHMFVNSFLFFVFVCVLELL